MGKNLNHVFVLNPEDNGGESIILQTTFHDACAGMYPNAMHVFTTQELTLSSYANSASFNMNGYFTPAVLRKLADELELAEAKALEELLDCAKANIK